MKYSLYIAIFLIGIILPGVLHAQQKQSDKDLVHKGNGYYKKGEYDNAIKKYDEALKKNGKNEKAGFNKGDALYRTKKYSEASDQFSKQAEVATTPLSKAKAYHNLGNSYLQQKDYEKAVESYKDALRNNPEDESTRYNLAYALKKQKEQQKKNDQNKDKNKQNDKSNQKDKQKDKDKQKQNDQEKDKKDKEKEKEKDKENSKDKDKKENQNNPEDHQDKKAQGAPEKPDRMKARQMLDAAEENEKKTRAKIYGGNKQKGKPQSGKDW